jgi:acyl-CoA-binding protein
MNIEKEYQDSIRFINNSLIDFYPIGERLKLYGLYKQSLFGDNKVSKPYFFYIKSSNKWIAWKKEFGKSKNQAKLDYINYVEFIKSKIIS